MLGEFEQISQLMVPLAQKAKGAFGLKDDAAVFAHKDGQELVVTTDTLIAGVHFFADDPADSIAVKLLGVNLSDLASMGATPLHYTLNASYPGDITVDWIKQFAAALHKTQEEHGIILLGGDTTRTDGPLTFSLTAFGTVPAGKAIRRTTARAGDLLCVSGTIGDGALGLNVALNKIPRSDYLLDRYRCPQPRSKLGPALIDIATACMDVSDGLLTDFAHMGVSGDIDVSLVPLSAAANDVLKQDSSLISTILNGGDDYELLFCTPESKEDLLEKISSDTNTNISVIGRITETGGIRVLDKDGQEVTDIKGGYRHF